MKEKRVSIRRRPTPEDFNALVEFTQEGYVVIIVSQLPLLTSVQEEPIAVIMSWEDYRRLRPKEG